MYNDQFVYKVVIWAFFGISLWKEKVALIIYMDRIFLNSWTMLPPLNNIEMT